MPHYKLTYFNIRGLGEGARLLFHYADVKFEDVRLEFEQWPPIKPTTPFGQLPFLEVDGEVIAQSAAIYRYLGKQFGLTTGCPIGDALTDMFYDAHKDFDLKVRDSSHVFAGMLKGDKEKLIKENFLPACDEYFGYLKKYLEKSKGNYLTGDKLTWADIVIADDLGAYTMHVPQMFDKHPEVKKFVDDVCSLPKIAKRIAERPKTAI